jgi:hypothetical protein
MEEATIECDLLEKLGLKNAVPISHSERLSYVVDLKYALTRGLAVPKPDDYGMADAELCLLSSLCCKPESPSCKWSPH